MNKFLLLCKATEPQEWQVTIFTGSTTPRPGNTVTFLFLRANSFLPQGISACSPLHLKDAAPDFSLHSWLLLVLSASIKGVLRRAFQGCPAELPPHPARQCLPYPPVVFSSRRVPTAQVILLAYVLAYFCLPPPAWRESHESLSLSVLLPSASRDLAEPLALVWCS